MMHDDLGLSPIGRDLLDSARTFLRAEADPELLREAWTASGIPEASWRAARGMGWFRLLLSEELGGLAIEFADVGALFLAVGQHPFPGPLLEHTIAVPLAFERATAAGQERLSEALDGEVVTCLADPQADVRAPAAQEPRIREGRLDGRVALVRFADVAALALVAATGADGPALLAIPLDRPGVEVTRVRSADAATTYGTLRFDGTEVGEVDVVASGSAAERLLADARAALRLGVSCMVSGLTARMLEMTIEFLQVREQFGRPIGSFQAVKHIAANMAVRVESLRNVCLEALRSADAEDGGDWHRSAMIAKAYAAGLARAVSEDALQLHGGIGFTMEHDLHLYFRHALALQGLYGDERELATHLGRLLADGDETPQGAVSGPYRREAAARGTR